MRRFVGFAAVILAAASILLSQRMLHAQSWMYPQGSPQRDYQERLERHREQFQENIDRQRRNQDNTQGPAQRGRYGAIAYSAKSGNYGYSHGFSNRAQAEQRAKRECGQTDCEIAAWYQNACGAVAAGDDEVWAGGNGNSERAARTDAQKDCVNNGGKNCQVIVSHCAR